MTEVRTRFAPSPTGFQHLGGFRTAFFAYLLAKHYGGSFVLRVENTDQSRSVAGSVRFILEELAWFGITPDEGPSKDELEAIGESWDGAPDIGGSYGPYVQSLRSKRYQEVAEQLLADGHAYRCDCTPEMLQRERDEQMARKELPGYSGYCRTREVSKDTKHVIRFKMPQKRTLSFNDGVRGRVAWESIPLRDPVLMKSEGLPTYHLASVVDDHDMKISHVLRGVEWLPSTPLHLLLYEALGWEVPVIAHLPVINGSDGKKLSKRSGAATSREAREQGFLSEAVLNFVSLIGWAPGEGRDQEIFSRDELVSEFSLAGINQASGVFDIKKMEWMNGMYVRSMSNEDFIDRVQPFLGAAGVEVAPDIFAEIAPHVRERVKLLTEVAPMIEFLTEKSLDRDIQAMFKKNMDTELAVRIVRRAGDLLKELEEFSVETIEKALRAVVAELEIKVGPAFVVLRIAVTGKTITPPLFESFAALGKERVLARLEETADILENQ
jgi:glutamyl-tRNA synthetase